MDEHEVSMNTPMASEVEVLTSTCYECRQEFTWTPRLEWSEWQGVYVEATRPDVCPACGQLERYRVEYQLSVASLSDLGPRYRDVRFRNYTVGAHNATAFSTVEAWLDLEVEQRPNLTIAGPVNVGKTYLAALAHNYLHHIHVAALWLSAPSLIAAVKRSYSEPQSGEAPAMVAARRVPVLFLDDFGKGHGKAEWLEELWFVLMDYRYQRNLTTVITTERTGVELAARVGAAVMTRLSHGAWVATIREPAVAYRQPEVTT